MTTIDVRWILLGGALCACLPAPPEPAHGVVGAPPDLMTAGAPPDLMAAGAPTNPATLPDDPTPTGSASDGGSAAGDFPTAESMFSYINAMRQSYATHPAHDGYPWQGQDSLPRTWSLTMSFDAALSATAQAEADRLGLGGAPVGAEFRYQNSQLFPQYDQESIWLSGLDSPTFQLSAKSHADLVTGPNNLPQKWHLYGNGTLRQGVAYQTGTGAFNHKSRLGVGRCALPNGDVWWILVFGS